MNEWESHTFFYLKKFIFREFIAQCKKSRRNKKKKKILVPWKHSPLKGR